MITQSPTDMLETEHRFIAKVVGAAPVIADQLAAGQSVNVETLQNIVEFMRTYADQCHHGKEENLLFPLLTKKGVPAQGCPVGVLTMEHTKGRGLVKGLEDATKAYQQGEPGAKEAIIMNLRGIAELYPNHIWKEDYLLFPLTHKVLNVEELHALYSQFEQVEQSIGREVHHRLELFAEWLEQQSQMTYKSAQQECE